MFGINVGIVGVRVGWGLTGACGAKSRRALRAREKQVLRFAQNDSQKSKSKGNSFERKGRRDGREGRKGKAPAECRWRRRSRLGMVGQTDERLKGDWLEGAGGDGVGDFDFAVES